MRRTSDARMALDAPAASAVVAASTPFVVRGWAVDLVVYMRSTVTGTFSHAQVVRVTVDM